MMKLLLNLLKAEVQYYFSFLLFYSEKINPNTLAPYTLVHIPIQMLLLHSTTPCSNLLCSSSVKNKHSHFLHTELSSYQSIHWLFLLHFKSKEHGNYISLFLFLHCCTMESLAVSHQTKLHHTIWWHPQVNMTCNN